MVDSEQQRRFAVDVVKKLRAAGFEAYFAGGCVRDQLLGQTPKDYDVATNATPPEIRRLFGHRRTLAIGAAFGVINVLGPKPAGQVEVTTFRKDAAYSDGRHPDHVTFSSAQEDASRRDFTINGLFGDPIAERVIDFVGGRDDLAGRVIRAIGQPRERFAEDKLRMLRAVRFSASLDFRLEADTLAAIREMAGQITVVSPERIAMEMRRMLVDPRRADAVRMMLQTGLATAILPEIVPADDAGGQRLDRSLTALGRLKQPSFPLALATLLLDVTRPAGARRVCRRWRLSNHQTDRTAWLLRHRAALANARAVRWSRLQPILIAEGIEDLLALHEAAAAAGADDSAGTSDFVGADESARTNDVAYCRSLLEKPRQVLDPPPLLTGDDLLAHGVPSGPDYRTLLGRIREAQLDEEIGTKAQALTRVDQLREEMDKKAKKKIQSLNQRIQKLQQQLAGARKQMDDPDELKTLEDQLAAAEAELAKAKEA